MTYTNGEIKQQKIKIAEKITKDFFNKSFKIEDLNKNDFVKVWKISRELRNMQKKYKA